MGAEATVDASAGEPTSKIVDVALGQAADTAAKAEAANDNAAKPATSEGAQGEGATEGATFAPDPNKLERARAAARAKLEDNRRRQAAHYEAQRREQDRLQAHAAAQASLQRAEALQRQLDALRDPSTALEHLEKIGLKAKTLAEKAVEQSTPEARLRAELEARVEERVGAVQKQYQEEIAKLNADRQERERQVAVQGAQQRFLATAANEESFPAVARVVALGSEWKASILAEATRVLQEAHQRTGFEYSDEEVLAYLDEKYSKLIPGQKNGVSTSNALKEATQGAGAQEKTAAGGTRTLTNQASQAKGSLPPDFDSLSERDQKAALAALYRASRRP